MFNITGSILQGGTATGITRGLLISPTLSSATDYRGLEVITRNNANDSIIKLNNGSTDLFVVKGDSKIGFFGATPVVKQTLGTGTAGASYTATEQGMLQRVYDAIRTYGLGT
jgi:C4-type Zn-finger protein